MGVAAVTAGPGLTNTLTAVKNAQMAESPLLLLGGAAATLLKGSLRLLIYGNHWIVECANRFPPNIECAAAFSNQFPTPPHPPTAQTEHARGLQFGMGVP